VEDPKKSSLRSILFAIRVAVMSTFVFGFLFHIAALLIIFLILAITPSAHKVVIEIVSSFGLIGAFLGPFISWRLIKSNRIDINQLFNKFRKGFFILLAICFWMIVVAVLSYKKGRQIREKERQQQEQQRLEQIE
jgi:hypothetical protein